MQHFNQRTGNLRKCARSEETCPEGATETYFRTAEKPLGQRFAGDDVFYQRFLKMTRGHLNERAYYTDFAPLCHASAPCKLVTLTC